MIENVLAERDSLIGDLVLEGHERESNARGGARAFYQRPLRAAL
jgi:hypothetical protein